MKNIILFFAAFTYLSGYSQNFTYYKAISNGTSIKTEGEVLISDTLISIYTDGVPASFKVEKTLETEEVNQYKLIDQTNASMRFTLTNPATPSRKKPITLLIQTVDSFTFETTDLVYYLTK